MKLDPSQRRYAAEMLARYAMGAYRAGFLDECSAVPSDAWALGILDEFREALDARRPDEGLRTVLRAGWPQ